MLPYKSSKSKITFLIPPPLDGKQPVERVFGCNYGIYPIPNIFALTAAALLRKEGYELIYLDGPVMKWKRDDLLSFLSKDDSRIYCLYTVNLAAETDMITLKYIREKRGDIPVIFMGPSPTYNPETFLLDEHTFAIRGEMEITLKELADTMIKGNGKADQIKGISYINNGLLTHNPPRELLEELD